MFILAATYIIKALQPSLVNKITPSHMTERQVNYDTPRQKHPRVNLTVGMLFCEVGLHTLYPLPQSCLQLVSFF